MDPPVQHGGVLANPIRIEGVRYILVHPVSGPLKLSKKSDFYYYKGSVRSGDQSDEVKACDACILRFNKETSAEAKYNRLVGITHKSIIKPFGHGKRIIEQTNHSFLALEPFDTTFEDYTVKNNGPGVDQNRRVTEELIKLISDIVDGIEELHGLGYCCPALKAQHILVIKQCGSVSAKLWEFRACSSENQDQEKSEDWVSLASLIVVAASYSDEATDLHERMRSGQLKGRSILKHSALLTVREKFDNVLALNFHVSVNHEIKTNQTRNQTELKALEICATNIENDLDRMLYWQMPHCVSSRCKKPEPKTLRGFIAQLRTVIEHEVVFIPEEMIDGLTVDQKLDGKKVKDLEHHLQESCGKHFLAVQRLVAELNLIQ
ncbi:hypothetical protein ACP4OV_014506 [Aristida adscensionis]